MDARYDMGMIHRSCEHAIPPVLVEVLDEFHRRQVSYCYWKSSRRLHAVLAGEGDVDLLVAREDQHCVQAILLERDFKLFPSVGDRDHPATLSFLGYDRRSGQLIHIHLHFLLIVGERLLKNYRIPWEAVLLTRAILHPTLPIRILEPTSEAILLVVRACLELRRLDPMTLYVWQATTRKFALDRAELAAAVDRTTLRDLAAELLSEDLAELVADAFYGEQPLETQARLRRHATLCRISQLQHGRGAGTQRREGPALGCRRPEQACSPCAATMEPARALRRVHGGDDRRRRQR